MGRAFVSSEVGRQHLDQTGRFPKLTFAATVYASVTGTSQKLSAENYMASKRPIFMQVSVPQLPQVQVVAQSGYEYLTPGILDANLTYPGSWPDKAGHINFYNRVAPRNASFYTAAALQMSIFFMDHERSLLFPNVVPAGFLAVPGQNMVNPPLPQHTVFLPHMLTTQISNDALCILYHALEANDVMAAANYPVINRVYNATGNILACAYSSEAWYTAWHVLCQAACGMGKATLFEMDFLLGIVQNHPLHGYCDEGGIWRTLFSQYAVQPNCGVIVCDYNRESIGFVNFTTTQVIASAMTLQSVISRCLYEIGRDELTFMIRNGAPNEEVRGIISSVIDSIFAYYSESTKLELGYWMHYLNCDVGLNGQVDRHISFANLNYLKQFSSWMPTYSLDISASRIGSYDNKTVTNLNFVKFTGHCHIQSMLIGQHHTTIYQFDKAWDFSNGFYWLHPKINPNDGLMDTVFDGGIADQTNMSTNVINFLDGSVANVGTALGNHMWRDNGDLLPCAGELRTGDLGQHFVIAETIPEYAADGEYVISIERYMPLPAQRGEVTHAQQENVKFTRMNIVLRNRYHVEYDHFGLNRPKCPDLNALLFTFKRWDKYRVNAELKRLTKANRSVKYTCKQALADMSSIPRSSNSDYEEQDLKTEQAQVIDMFSRILSSTLLCNVIRYITDTYAADDDENTVITASALLIKLKKLSLAKEVEFKFVGSTDLSAARKAQTDEQSKKRFEDIVYVRFGFGSGARRWSPATYVNELHQLASLVMTNAHDSASAVDGIVHALGLDTETPYMLRDVEEMVHAEIAQLLANNPKITINSFINPNYNVAPTSDVIAYANSTNRHELNARSRQNFAKYAQSNADERERMSTKRTINESESPTALNLSSTKVDEKTIVSSDSTISGHTLLSYQTVVTPFNDDELKPSPSTVKAIIGKPDSSTIALNQPESAIQVAPVTNILIEPEVTIVTAGILAKNNGEQK
jgi:hypothetical protein